MKRKAALALTAAVMAASLTGCATILGNCIGTSVSYRTYRGASLDAGILFEGTLLYGDGATPFARILSAFDFPLSFALDTILLPLTLIHDAVVACSTPESRKDAQ